MTPYMWAMLFLAGAIAFMVLEMFVPSGGLLSLFAISSLVTSIVLVYYHRGFNEGTIYLGILAVLIPTMITSAIRWWPYTPIGRRILNVDPDGYAERVESPHVALVGKHGVSVTTMLLSGSVRIDGKVYDAVSDGQAIEANQPIKVVTVEGNRILVRAAQPEALADHPDDPLSRPASEVIGDPFDDPLA